MIFLEVISVSIIRFACICLVLLFSFSCSKTPVISFCEGVDKEGNGIHCGKKFSTGDLTAVIKVNERFETETLKIAIYKKTNYKNEQVSNFSHAVGSDKSSAAVPLSFYMEGEYLIEVHGKDDRILGAEWLQVVDTY